MSNDSYNNHHQSTNKHLIVAHNGGSWTEYDHFTGEDLRIGVKDNGALVINEGVRYNLAAYPAGVWVKVTPVQKEETE